MAKPEISDELGVVVLEQRAGRPRADAWKHFAERTGVDSVRNLVSVLVQSEQFGTSIAKTLRIHADTLRVQRRQKVEEQAAKTTVKLVFPLVLFIFPSIFLVALGPAAIIISESVSKDLSTVERRENNVDSPTIIRIVSGVFFVVILVILIQRRRTRVR